MIRSDNSRRAWRISALAVRSAISLGLNLRNSYEHIAEIDKEIRNRIWWCLYTVEHMLGIMTGRATCARSAVRTSPLPLPFDDDQFEEPLAAELLNFPKLRDARINTVMASSQVRQGTSSKTNGMGSNRIKPCDPLWLHGLPTTSGLCFLYHCDLAVLTEEIANEAYTRKCVSVPWAEFESRIRELRTSIESWHSSLPIGLRFTLLDDDGQVLPCHTLSLALQYYSARIMLGRPWLDREKVRHQGGPTEEMIICHEIAAEAVEAAIRILDIVSGKPDTVCLYKICQWWRILHYMMQATTTVLLELSFGKVQIPGKDEYMLSLAKRAVQWLYSLAERSIASRRAWQFCETALRRLAMHFDYDVSDMPSSDE